ncbi:Dolichyl-phosphate-mannose--protein O-mannosyl transferase [Modestobacter italicus]|uniref:Dolichyl-phosphate-mannose--protein O-mannosyl transferase n=1 Tax=Modestobacter italicus (strain DSM 44449 / CECT 9708 / BC 501) TaxID=2732864 RepID=I4ER78_MODI5|nr:phospholipid carrier-dependent glycosyltransferase [Modestobacter marinus]CCH85891.1 Dolichyl-phosphate-mannose--protein O-mannosyl transferase [Modestobacter marinus]
MTAIAEHLPTAPSVITTHRTPRARRLAGAVWTLPLVAGLVALLVRAVGLRTSNDVFIDELLYARFADQVAHGQWPGADGVPFFLHPIGSFALDGLVVRVLGLSGSTIDLVLQLRWVNAVLGALTVVLVAVLVRRLAGPRIAVLAAVVLAFDPFVLRSNGRVMIETPAVLWLLAGWLVLLIARERSLQRPAVRWELAAGLLLGMALVTKDMTVVPGLGAVALAVMWRRTLPVWTAVRVGAAALVPYLISMAVVASLGLLPEWAEQKRLGAERMLGMQQTTGFNAAGGGSLGSRLVDELGRFGTSYVLLAVCVPAGLVALFSVVAARRFIGLIAVCTGALGVYAVGFGAAEEQFGYYVVVTAVLAVAVALPELVARRQGLRRSVAVLVVLFTVSSVVLGVQSRFVSDDSFREVEAWLGDELPVGAEFAVTGDAAELAFPEYAVAPSLMDLRDDGVDYVLTNGKPVTEGYGYAAPELLDWLAAHAMPVLRVEGPSNGETVVWQLDRDAVDDAVDSGTTIPAVRTAAR